MKKILYLPIAVLCWNCTPVSVTEKYQGKRDRIVNVREKVKEIKIDEVPISSFAQFLLINEYMLISDYHAPDKLIHVFDRNNFSYVTSVLSRGLGPGEITNPGHMEADHKNRRFFVSDHGKQQIFCYYMDSLLAGPSCLPEIKMTMNETRFPGKYQYINDTLCIGLIIEPVGNSDYRPVIAKWNMLTGEIRRMNYEHPKIEKKRTVFAASMDKGIYVECYLHHDLMTVCSLDGELKYNIYGPKWNDQTTNRFNYYGRVAFCNGRIVASFSDGDDASSTARYPEKFLVFNLDGDYIQTLETDYQIVNFCYDDINNRLIMCMDDEIQFAYLDLDGLI